jgi:hypothetical protein
MGENDVTLIHGHGRKRGISPGFVSPNTGYFGLEIRRALRQDKELRQWIRYTTLDRSHMGVTRVKLKQNPALTRSDFGHNLLPEKEARSAKLAIHAANSGGLMMSVPRGNSEVAFSGPSGPLLTHIDCSPFHIMIGSARDRRDSQGTATTITNAAFKSKQLKAA